MDEFGLDTGLKDRNGVTVHLGDTLSFDPKEWGGVNDWVLRFSDGELNINYPPDITRWCTVIKKWNEK